MMLPFSHSLQRMMLPFRHSLQRISSKLYFWRYYFVKRNVISVLHAFCVRRIALVDNALEWLIATHYVHRYAWNSKWKFACNFCTFGASELLTTLLTFYALFGDDAKLAGSSVDSDFSFDVVTGISFGVFSPQCFWPADVRIAMAKLVRVERKSDRTPVFHADLDRDPLDWSIRPAGFSLFSRFDSSFLN